jgi:tetratricopeptide (TPR) repeat protein
MNKKTNRIIRFGWLLFFAVVLPTMVHSQISLPPAAQEAFDKGVTAAKLPDFPLAIRYFEEARKIAPEAPVIYLNLGIAESKIPGRELRAICWFSAFLAADPNSEKAAAVKEQIQLLEVKSQSNLSRLVKMLQDSPIGKNYLRSIATLWAKAGDYQSAVRIALSITDNNSEIYDIAKIQAIAGDGSGALKTLELAKDKYGGFYLSVAEDMAKNGDRVSMETAIATARQRTDLITSASDKNISLGNIAWTQMVTDNKAGARETYKAALAVAESLSDIADKTNRQRYLACSQIQAEDIEGAKQTLLLAFKNSELIGDPNRRASNQYDIVVCQAKSGDLENALKSYNALLNSFNQISDAEKKKPFTETYFWIAQSTLAEAHIKSGDLVQALKWANEITNQERKSPVLHKIAEAQAESRDFVGALKTASEITEPIYKSLALYSVSYGQADSRDYDSADKTAEMMQNNEYKNYAIKYIAKRKAIDIVEDKAKAGDFSGIVKMSDEIPDPKEKASRLYTIVSDFAESHNFDLAVKVAAMIQDDTYKNYATNKIAEERAKATNTPYTPPPTPIKLPQPLTAAEWIKKINDLEANYFLDLSEYLKALPADDAGKMYSTLYASVSKITEQQSFISKALKRKPPEQPK